MAGDVPLHEKAKRRKLEETEVEEAEDLYSCMSCLLGARTEMLYHGVQLMSDSFFNYLLSSINDLTSDQRSQSMGKVVVTVQVDCENCREEIEVKAGITAAPVWADQEESDEVSSSNSKARISHFQNFKVIDVLPPDTNQDTSLRKCFFSEDDEAEPDWSSFVPSDIDHRQAENGEPKQKTLIACARTAMHSGSSFYVYDAVEQQIMRLIFRINGKKCSVVTSEDLTLGERFRLAVLRHPQYQKNTPAPTLLPHRNCDLLVDKTVKHLPYPTPVDLFELLQPIAKSTIKKVFSPGHIYDKKYVWLNRNCPSVGVLLCKDFNVQLCASESGTRIKVYLDECWDLPVTGAACDKLKDKGREMLLVLGLSSPWNNEGSFKPARCYIMCIATITNSSK